MGRAHAVSAGVQVPDDRSSPLTPRGKIPPRSSGEIAGKKIENATQGKPPYARELSIAYRPLSSLKPYERNARTHSVSQIAKLKASLRAYGWTTPILVAGNDIIAGHARHQAATEMLRDHDPIAGNADPELCPCADLSHLSASERKAYIIADNRLAEDAGWDADLLRMEFADLSLGGFDLSLTGFDPLELSKIIAPEPARTEDRELSPEEEDAMDRAWLAAVREWHSILLQNDKRDYVTTTYTKGALQILYLRSLYFGDDIPRGATFAYTPHRVSTSGDKGSIIDAIASACEADAKTTRRSIRWVSLEKPSLDRLIGATTLAIHGMRVPGDFPALLARDLIEEFAPKNAAMLDPCHGWGGRMLGFLLSAKAQRYVGYDPSPSTNEGVLSLFRDLAALTPERRKFAELHQMPFEDAKIAPAAFDFALTSPPYFDTEKYGGDDSSFRRYADFDAWCANFYEPLIQRTARALKRNSVFCLQVGSQSYPLVERALAIAPKHRMSHEATRHTNMVNNRMGTEPDDGEVIVIFRRV